MDIKKKLSVGSLAVGLSVAALSLSVTGCCSGADTANDSTSTHSGSSCGDKGDGSCGDKGDGSCGDKGDGSCGDKGDGSCGDK